MPDEDETKQEILLDAGTSIRTEELPEPHELEDPGVVLLGNSPPARLVKVSPWQKLLRDRQDMQSAATAFSL
jgi:hypothetical protein